MKKQVKNSLREWRFLKKEAKSELSKQQNSDLNKQLAPFGIRIFKMIDCHGNS